MLTVSPGRSRTGRSSTICRPVRGAKSVALGGNARLANCRSVQIGHLAAILAGDGAAGSCSPDCAAPEPGGAVRSIRVGVHSMLAGQNAAGSARSSNGPSELRSDACAEEGEGGACHSGAVACRTSPAVSSQATQIE